MAQRSSLNLVLFPFGCLYSFYILLLNKETLNNDSEKQFLKHSFESLWETDWKGRYLKYSIPNF